MTDTPPGTELPEGYTPPLVHGGLFVNANWAPRLVDRSGSVRTDLGGVAEHWPRDIAHVFYPDLPNPFWYEVPGPPEVIEELPPEGEGDVHVVKVIFPVPDSELPSAVAIPVVEAAAEALAAEEESSDVPSAPPGVTTEAAEAVETTPVASEAPVTSEDTTEAAPDMTEYEMDQMWGIEGTEPQP